VRPGCSSYLAVRLPAVCRYLCVYPCRVDTREAAQRWADVWEHGWHEHDAAAIAALYAEGAFWQQHPFRDPEPGNLARVFVEEESAQCRFGTPIVDGDQAAVAWSAQTRLRDGGTEDLAGVSLLRFGATDLSWKSATSGPRADAHTPASPVFLQTPAHLAATYVFQDRSGSVRLE
jgi:hypothetical protein